MEKSDSKEHKLSKIRCTLFSLTKLSVPRTIEKHCRATIWLLRPKIWTHFQTITTHYDFPDGVYYCTEFIQIKIKCFIMMTGNIKQHMFIHCLITLELIFLDLYVPNIRPFPDLRKMTIMKVSFVVLSVRPPPF